MTTVARTIKSGAFLAGFVLAGALVSRNGRGSRRDFSGKVVFITGSSRGLGLALAEEFLRCGARVVVSARNPRDLAEARLQLQQLTSLAEGAAVMQVVCDVTDSSSVQTALELAQSTFGPIDVLVNNAGIMAVAHPYSISLLSALKRRWIPTSLVR
jgi:NAD(P)-dependent dehydrogenase (short-subunit alcohol dehydrogenase family)